MCSNFLPKLQRRWPCRNFAYYSMLIILSWRPSGRGPWHHASPPKYARASEYCSTLLFFTRHIAENGSLPHLTRENSPSSLTRIQWRGIQEYHRWKFPLTCNDPEEQWIIPILACKYKAHPTLWWLLSETGGDSTLLGLMFVQSDAQ